MTRSQRCKANNRKRIYKKLTWIIVIIFLCGLSTIRQTTVKADDTIIEYDDEIKILEIEPGNQYRLTNKSTNIQEEEVIDKVDGIDLGQTKIRVTHITMAKFISMVDEVNGQYDAVVIGRKNEGLDSTYSDSKQYRDYTNPTSQLMKGLRYSRGGTANNFTNAKNPDTLADGRTYVEYYSENDITAKRAKEIQAMIKSNQLVYMEDTIFNSTGDKQITQTNLYKIFNIYNSAPEEYVNFKNVPAAQINLKDIVTAYNGLSNEVKRPKITSVTKPTDDKKEDTASVYNRNMKFKLNVSSSQSETLKVKIYLDINADGLFKEKELYKTRNIQVNPQNSEYEVSCELDKDFMGYLDWKVEVIREKEVVKGTEKIISQVKSNVVSNSQFKSLDGKRNIRILQVTPDHKSGNLYLDNNINDANKNFNYLLQGKDKDVNGNTIQNNNVTDYNFKIDCIKYDSFNSKVAAGTLKLNGNYDMVIIGFSDNYGNNEFSQAAIKELDSFVATGQSVMFTHDTMSMNSINNLDINAGPKEITQHFRDYLGQSVFKDPLKLADGDKTTLQKEINEKDIYKDVIITRNNDGEIINYELKDKNIIHKDFQQQYGVGLGSYSDEQKNKLYSMGTTLRSITFDTTYDTSVKKINGAQISEYPYELGTTNDDSDNNQDTFNVAQTHTQWYQINLEDPDVVPWYNLNSSKISSKFDDGDSKNYYYTYSRGNLTYSGTGHSNGYTQEEFKLFINTMVKAERGANHAPKIICSIPREYTGETTVNDVIAGGKHNFTVDADDLEHEIVDMHVTIDGEELTSDNINEELEDRGGEDDKTKDDQVFSIYTTDNDRKAVEIEIPDSKLQNVNDQVVIQIDATDVQGAKSEKKYVLKAVNAPDFQVNANLTKLNTVDQNNNDMEQPIRYGDSIKVEKTSRIKVGYTIQPQSLQYGDAVNNMQKEVAILIDTSMTDKYQQFTQSKNGIRNSILGKFLSQDISKERDDVKFDLIAYGDTVQQQYVDSQAKDQNGYLLNYRDQLEQKLNNISPSTVNSSGRKLGQAIERAVDFFDANNQKSSGKTIIIISSGDPTDSISDDYLNKIRGGNYNIITLAVDDSTQLGNLYSKLFAWHNELGGLSTDYYLSKPDNVATEQWTHNNIANDIIPKISETLTSFKYRTYTLKNIKLKFNLGPDIDLDQGLIDDPDSDNGKEYIKDLPQIKYIAKELVEGEQKKLVYYGYFQGGISEVDIGYYNTDFIIKPNQDSNVIERVFRDYNLLMYTDVIGTSKKKLLTTPKLIIDSAIDHGVYKRIEEGKATLDKNENGTLGFAKKSVVTFGANIMGMDSFTNLAVTIDSNAIISERPKAYKVLSSGELQWLGDFTISDSDSKVFNLINFDGVSNNNIVVLYSIKLNTSGDYTNYIKVYGTSIPATVKSEDKELPDLF